MSYDLGRMSSETLIVPRAPFDIEDPWTAPAACTPVRLRCATDASTPRLATSVAVWFDDEALTILFSSSDDHIFATHDRHDAPLYEEDVVEAFLAPRSVSDYFEIEVSPRGTVFDARVHSPEGERKSMTTDPAWTCEGLFAAVRQVTESDGTISVDTVLRIPFASLKCDAPRNGGTWRANFFRIDRHSERGNEFSAWQPTMRTPADFHVTRAFGTLRFI